jgi:hypothetical protein
VGADPVPDQLDWIFGLAQHPSNLTRKGSTILETGEKSWISVAVHSGIWGHIFDTPYNALQLDVLRTIHNDFRKPTGFGFPNETLHWDSKKKPGFQTGLFLDLFF